MSKIKQNKMNLYELMKIYMKLLKDTKFYTPKWMK